ncbi:hypothetical protein [Costertonia aggregata]|uniref:Uncharacterized protein n=1 Tax=Costertonia aggregata TaxID=343403 RepID=A0A7H9AMG2_9FLAO|nr:hypothetical protein [Costertonia aggregata]QLG44646.1 hypothetical protein HYG79_04545 [Costertonia aggregata]
MDTSLKIGLFGSGLDTYWTQFDGFLEHLFGYQREVAKNIKDKGVEVINCDVLYNHTNANAAAALFNIKEVSCILLFDSTYSLSHNVIPLVPFENKLSVHCSIFFSSASSGVLLSRNGRGVSKKTS